ncbi:MAG: type 4 pilus major pilin [Rhodanobacter sp.]
MFNRINTVRRGGKRKQLGQMSVEQAIAIAIAALVLAGIIYYVTVGRHNVQVNSESANLTSIVAGTQKLYGQDPTSYANVTAAALINNGVVPTSEVNGTAIESSFGTPITVAPATCYQANDCVAFTYQVDPNLCSDFVTAVSGNLAKVSVGGTVVKDSTAGTAMAAAALGTACSSTNGAKVPTIFTASR